MIKITYNGSVAKLQEAVGKANELLAGTKLYEAIAQKAGFDNTTATGAQVAASIRSCPLELTVKTYKNPFSRALGFEDPNDPTSIHINIAGNKLDRSVGSIAGTFIHEAVHAADADDDRLSYPHRGNRASGNEDTAPYWIGSLAVRILDQPELFYNISDVQPVAHALEADGEDFNFHFYVNVRGGERPPVPIHYTLAGPPNDAGSSPKSFGKGYHLPAGAYDLTVSGSNPDGGSTEVLLKGDFDGDPEPRDSRDTPVYTMRFAFVIR